MNKQQPIGVIDSGVGGLTVLRRLQELMPHEHFIFLGDTLNTPYGNRSREDIIRLVNQMTDYLSYRNIKALVAACNTITVLGEETIRNGHDFEVIGMAKGSKMIPRVTKTGRIGIMATDFTISTGAHKKEIEAAHPEYQVFGVGCPRLVPLIEHEQFGTAELKDAIKEYTDILKSHDVDTVMLSCTHYPFLKKEIEAAMGPAVTVLDPAEVTAKKCRYDLCERDLLCKTGTGTTEICFTTDLERGLRLASLMVDLSACRAHVVGLERQDPAQKVG